MNKPNWIIRWIVGIALAVITAVFIFLVAWFIKGKTDTSVIFQPQIIVDTISSCQNGNYAVKNEADLYFCFKEEPEPGIYMTKDGNDFEVVMPVHSVQQIASNKNSVFFISQNGLFHVDKTGNIIQKNDNITQADYMCIQNNKLFVLRQGGLMVFDVSDIEKTVTNSHFKENNIFSYEGRTINIGVWQEFVCIVENGDQLFYKGINTESFLPQREYHTIMFPTKNGIVYCDWNYKFYTIYQVNKNKSKQKLADFQFKETLPSNNYAVYGTQLVMLSQQWKENGPTTHNNQMTNNHKCDTVNIIDLEQGTHTRVYESQPGERVLFADTKTLLTYYKGNIQCRNLKDLSLIYEEEATYLKKPGEYHAQLAGDRVFLYKQDELMGSYAVR